MWGSPFENSAALVLSMLMGSWTSVRMGSALACRRGTWDCCRIFFTKKLEAVHLAWSKYLQKHRLGNPDSTQSTSDVSIRQISPTTENITTSKLAFCLSWNDHSTLNTRETGYCPWHCHGNWLRDHLSVLVSYSISSSFCLSAHKNSCIFFFGFMGHREVEVFYNGMQVSRQFQRKQFRSSFKPESIDCAVVSVVWTCMCVCVYTHRCHILVYILPYTHTNRKH